MRTLKYITFTGIDEFTDPAELMALQEKYPKIEFGVLLTRSWADHGHRYPSPEILKRLPRELHLSGHLCGTLAREAVKGDWSGVAEFCGPGFDLFRRFQINEPLQAISWTGTNPLEGRSEIVLQRKYASDIDYVPVDTGLSVLLDPSGGRGIASEPVATGYRGPIGYAGGIGPENVKEVLETIKDIQEDGWTWIDMESSLRGDTGKFDIDRVKEVLRKIYG